MPSYNAEKYLDEAIESILNQTFEDFEFIIINDGSTDRTEEIILSYKDDRIRYIKNESNIKLIASLNKGFRLATGKYIARMDADDISLPTRLEKQLLFMESHPDIGISGGQMEIFGYASGGTDYPLTHEECLLHLLDQPCFSNNLFFIRKELVVKHNLLFSEEYLHAEDYKFYVDVLAKIKGANLPDILTKYRQHETSITHKFFSIAFNNRKKIRIEYIQELLGVNPLQAEYFYGKIGNKRSVALRNVEKVVKAKFISLNPVFLNKLLYDKLWYKDALYESEQTINVVFRYAYIFLVKINKVVFLNWINVLKHYLKCYFAS